MRNFFSFPFIVSGLACLCSCSPNLDSDSDSNQNSEQLEALEAKLKEAEGKLATYQAEKKLEADKASSEYENQKKQELNLENEFSNC